MKIEQHPAPTGNHSPEQAKQSLSPRNVDEDTQTGRVFATLTKGRSLNKFEAESLGDHALNTTISKIQIRYGIVADRKWENLHGYLGRPTRVMRYWFNDVDREVAKRVLGWT